MKAEITTKERAFEPIEVKITIESLEELECLLLACNTTVNMKNESRFRCISVVSRETNQKLWSVLGVKLENILFK